MVKYFSADWLAQSHQLERAATHAHRPHVPCMVQPRAPTFGKSCLEPKVKAPKPPQPPRPPQQPESASCSLSEGGGGDSSGYESEAAPSERLSVDGGGGGGGDEAGDEDRQRRARVKFSPEQISQLEKIFSRNRYLDAGERVKTAQRLHLTETQVRTWFQNRRVKLKREVQDFLAPRNPSVRRQPLQPVGYQYQYQYQYQYPSSCTGRTPHPLPGVPQLLLRPPRVFIQHAQFC